MGSAHRSVARGRGQCRAIRWTAGDDWAISSGGFSEAVSSRESGEHREGHWRDQCIQLRATVSLGTQPGVNISSGKLALPVTLLEPS